jgi:hypothetical protein
MARSAELYGHPNPALDRWIQRGAILVAALMLLAALGLLFLGLRGLPLMALASLVTLALIAPVLMLTAAAPAVQLSEEGLTIHPVVWPAQLIRWDEVRAIKDYPLMPPPGSEVERRALVGRKKYRAPAGRMLIVPSLPIQYRFTGFFAGEGFTPVIAITNRTHTDYEKLIRVIENNLRGLQDG